MNEPRREGGSDGGPPREPSMAERRGRSRRRLVRRLLFGAAVGVSLLTAVTARVVVSGEQEIAASTAALERGDPWEATVHARRAASWYAPGAPHVAVAYLRLQAIAHEAEKRKRLDVALLAWGGVRAAAQGSRWLLAPRTEELRLANSHLARLRAAGASDDPAARGQGEHLQGLLADERPRTAWVVALIVGLATWAAGMVLGGRQLAGPGGRAMWRPARSGGALALVGLLTWLVAVWRA